MAYLVLENVSKVYDNGFKAVHGVSLAIEKGDFLVLVGPSGCAKSTVLRMIAGLEEISDGKIIIDDKVVNDTLPKDRDIAMVFQDYALYPHMSIYDNISFGLKLKNVDKKIIESKVQQVAKNLEILHLLDRKPKQLSGGQRQRVALARALIKEPKVFLLDEPLSNLDAKLRVSTRAKISELHRSLDSTIVYVTHDQIEAMTMGNKICVLNAGKVMQMGKPLDLYNYPANKFVASFIGSPAMNILEGTLSAKLDDLFFTIADINIKLPESKHKFIKDKVGQKIYFGIRPSRVSVVKSNSSITIKGTVLLIEKTGSQTFVHFEVEGQNMIAKIKTEDIELLNLGDVVDFYMDMEKCHIFDYQSENNLTIAERP